MAVEINNDNIKYIHYKLGEFYISKSDESSIDSCEYNELALSNFQIAKKYDHKTCQKIICDLMMNLKYYMCPETIGIVLNNIHAYITHCKWKDIDCDKIYIVYYVYLNLLNNINFKKEIESYVGMNEKISEYNIEELVEGIREKNVSTYAKKMNDRLDKHMVTILLMIKNTVDGKIV